jgi:phytanoyl-CoA hydroxylase
VPGSHQGPIYDHHGPDGRFCGAMDPERCDIDLSRALPCVGKAGSITIHHVRAVHGSATNFSGRERRFLLYQYRAADAWPLLGLKEGIDKFNEQLLAGEPSLAPRLANVPVRMPLPPAAHQGSIYENQRASGRRYFATADTPLVAAE